MLGDIKSNRLLIAKGFMFFVGGCLASGLLLADSPTLRTALLLAIAIWCFARFYYFAFYVLERYVDREYRYAGLISATRFAIRRFTAGDAPNVEDGHD